MNRGRYHGLHPFDTSTASTTILRMTRLARLNLLFYRAGLLLASTRARFSGSASAVSESSLLDSMAFARSSRAIVRYPTWMATTTSPPRRPLACPAQGSAACGVTCSHFRLERPHLGSQPQARWPAVTRRLRHTCGILTSRTTTSSTPIPRTPDASSTPVRGGQIGMSVSGVSFSDEVLG